MICRSKHLFYDNEYKLFLNDKVMTIGKTWKQRKYHIPLKLSTTIKWVFSNNHTFKGFEFIYKSRWKTMLLENEQCLELRETLDGRVTYKNLTHLYNIIHPIKQGISSTTYLSLCCIDQKKYLLQTFQNVTSLNDKEYEQLVKMITFDYPNIKKYEEYFVEDHNLYVVTHFSGGKTLQERLNSQYRIELNEILFIMKTLLNLIVQIHKQGCVCKDLSTNSIYLQNDGEVTFLDFDTFINLEDACRTKSGSKDIDFSQELKQIDSESVEVEKFNMQQKDVLLCGKLLNEMLKIRSRQKNVIDKQNQLSSLKTIIIGQSTNYDLFTLLKKMTEPDPRQRINALNALYFLEDMEFDDRSFEDFPDCSENQNFHPVLSFSTKAYLQ